MTEPRDYFPNVFNPEQAKSLRAAFELASATPLGRKIEPGPLAEALIVIASAGELDPRAMADRALKRCAAGLF